MGKKVLAIGEISLGGGLTQRSEGTAEAVKN